MSQKLLDMMKESRSDTMHFEITRDPVPDRTFSKDALEEFLDAIHDYAAMRVVHHFDNRKPGDPGPSAMRVMVRVEIDGESVEVSASEFPWYTVDGSHRGGVH